MSTKAELQALLERVKAATGADREIDRDLAGYPVGTTKWRDIPPSTASLDAITALIERELPGLCPGVSQNVHHFYWVAWLSDVSDDGVPREVASGRSEFTASLALTAAFLSAMIAQMEVGNDH